MIVLIDMHVQFTATDSNVKQETNCSQENYVHKKKKNFSELQGLRMKHLPAFKDRFAYCYEPGGSENILALNYYLKVPVLSVNSAERESSSVLKYTVLETTPL